MQNKNLRQFLKGEVFLVYIEHHKKRTKINMDRDCQKGFGETCDNTRSGHT